MTNSLRFQAVLAELQAAGGPGGRVTVPKLHQVRESDGQESRVCDDCRNCRGR